jgi:type II secretory pathway component GspD/PulD (secretin)
MQEAATIVRTCAELPKVSVEAAQSSLTFDGPAAQVATAQWILTQLNTPGNEGAALEYKMPSGEEAVRVNFLATVSQPQQMQEMLTVLRTVADVIRVFNFTAREALIVRAKPDQLAFAEWIIDQLNVPASQTAGAAPRIYPGSIEPGYGARVNYLANVTSTQGMQEMLTILRTVGNIAKVFNYSSLHALTLRAPDADLERAEWLIQKLDVPAAAQNSGAQVYQTPGSDDITRIFFLTNASQEAMQTVLGAIRSEAKIRKVFNLTAPAAVVVRGTADQVEAAVQVMAQRNGLAMLRR